VQRIHLGSGKNNSTQKFGKRLAFLKKLMFITDHKAFQSETETDDYLKQKSEINFKQISL
jgi:hypothetical protein